MLLAVAGRFKQADENRHGQTGGQCHRKLQPVVRVELKFWQKIGAGNAQERAGTKSERPAQENRIRAEKMTRTCIEQERAQRCSHGKHPVEHVAGETRAPAGGHERRDRHRVEWFVQNDNERGAQTHQPAVSAGFGGYGGSQRHAPQQRMKRHANRGRRPRKLAGGLFSQCVGGQAMSSAHFVAVHVLIACLPVFGRSFRYVVVVVGKK